MPRVKLGGANKDDGEKALIQTTPTSRCSAPQAGRARRATKQPSLCKTASPNHRSNRSDEKAESPKRIDLDDVEDLMEADVPIKHPSTGAVVGTIRLMGPENPVRRRLMFARIDRMNADAIAGVRRARQSRSTCSATTWPISLRVGFHEGRSTAAVLAPGGRRAVLRPEARLDSRAGSRRAR